VTKSIRTSRSRHCTVATATHPRKGDYRFFNNAPQVTDVKTLRVTGQAEFLEDPELKAKVLEARPFYKNFGTGEPDDPTYPVVRVAHGEAWFWTMDYVLREAEAERIRF
jgi:uncharacterized pyridoxamine 5'-phosphate oxidase family protein